MDDWQKDFFKMLDDVGVELEEIFQNVGEAVDIWFDDLNQTFGHIHETFDLLTEEFQNSVGTDIKEYFQEIFEPLVDIYAEIEEMSFDDTPSDTDSFINPKIEATPEHHPACIGCHNYHGRVYNGSLLVCGMHPYGWDDQNCPDWERKN